LHSNIKNMKEVVIISAVRTPIGSFMGSLSGISATKLGAVAIKGALDKANLNPKLVEEVYFGSVLQAGLGQAPARQAAKFAGLSDDVKCTTINKVCASGMKAITIAAQQIMTGQAEIIIAGGMENMSQVPHYLSSSRTGQKFGNIPLVDGLAHDGLLDVYSQTMMGSCADLCAIEYNFSREDQDNFAVKSYKRADEAWKNRKFDNEIVPVELVDRKGNLTLFAEDEEYKNVFFDKIPTLKPAFSKDGTVTAANASTMNDGAAALVLMSREKATELGLKPIAILKGFADAEQAPEKFTTAPAKAMPIALGKANLGINDIDLFEFNEAFAVVALANNKILNISDEKVNIYGGAVALGHPLGASGARIVVTLINALHQENKKLGAAAICNGGGGASAIVLEKC